MAWAIHSKSERSGRGVAIARWLHAANRRLRNAATTVAVQLSQYTNAAEFESTGKLIAFQSIETMAAESGLTDRTVQKNIRKLQAVGLVACPPNHGGRGRSNCYTLTLPADDTAETPSGGTPFSEAKPRLTRHPFDRERVNAEVVKGERRGRKPRPAGHPNYNNDIRTSSDHRDTDDRGPRQRADALGPLDPPPEASKRLGNGQGLAAEAEPPKPSRPLKALGPLGDREAELRSLLGERFKVLTMGTVVELTPDGVLVVEALTPSIGNMIRRDCEADLLAFTGAREFKIVIRMPTEPPPLRRM